MSGLLHTAETVHWVALGVMAVVYTTRLWWLLRFNKTKDRSPPGGRGRTNPQKGAMHSLANVAMPWAMESTRTDLFFYLTFVLFHLGVVCGISLAFLSSLVPSLVSSPPLGYVFLGGLAIATLVGLGRMVRRLTVPVMKLISTPDDYFSLAMLTVWFGIGVMAQAHLLGLVHNEALMVAFLFTTAFFLVYVPFSKISHYLYYPFTRYWLGRALGHRGSMPAVRG
jgi:hypothetical protein